MLTQQQWNWYKNDAYENQIDVLFRPCILLSQAVSHWKLIFNPFKKNHDRDWSIIINFKYGNWLQLSQSKGKVNDREVVSEKDRLRERQGKREWQRRRERDNTQTDTDRHTKIEVYSHKNSNIRSVLVYDIHILHFLGMHSFRFAGVAAPTL